MKRWWILFVAVGSIGCGSEAEPSASAERAAAEPVVAEEPAAEAGEANEGPPPEVERPYDESADAQAQIDAAVAAAREDGKRVVLMFGANWCSWCRRLEWVFQNEPRVSSTLERAYHLVHVDVGPRGSSTNRQVARGYGDPISQGLPCLVVLDEEGQVEHVQETGSLEVGDRHDPDRVLTFLQRWERS